MNKILVKYPTRNRPTLFLKTLENYIKLAQDNENITYLISIDNDDSTMTKEVIEKAKSFHKNVLFAEGNSKSKIQACNADINEYHGGWDIAVLLSDDMFCRVQGWDFIIRRDMNKYFPDMDGCLWYYDGSQRSICTQSILGKKYYDRFKYLYYPEYKSFFCDNEFTEVASSLNKIRFNKHTIFSHEHPAWGKGVQYDELYKVNDKHWAHDEELYKKRRLNGYKN